MDPAKLTNQELVDYLVHAVEEQDVVFVLFWLEEMKGRGMLEKKDGKAGEGVTTKHSWKPYSALIAVGREEETVLRRFILQLLLHFTGAPERRNLALHAPGWVREEIETWLTGGQEQTSDAARCLSLGAHSASDWIDAHLPPPPNPASLTGTNPLPLPPIEQPVATVATPGATAAPTHRCDVQEPSIAPTPAVEAALAPPHTARPTKPSSPKSQSPPLVAQVPLNCQIRLVGMKTTIDRPTFQQQLRLLSGLFGIKPLDGGDFRLEFLSEELARTAMGKLSSSRLSKAVTLESDYQSRSLNNPSALSPVNRALNAPVTTAASTEPVATAQSPDFSVSAHDLPQKAPSVPSHLPPLSSPSPTSSSSPQHQPQENAATAYPPLIPLPAPLSPSSFGTPSLAPPPFPAATVPPLPPPRPPSPSRTNSLPPIPPLRSPPVSFLPGSQAKRTPAAGPFGPISTVLPPPDEPPLRPPIRCHLGNLPTDATPPEILALLDWAEIPYTSFELVHRVHCRSAYFTVPSRKDWLRASEVFHNAFLRGHTLHLERNSPDPAPHLHPLVIVCGLPSSGGVRLVEDLSRKTRSGAYKREMVPGPGGEGGLGLGLFRVPSPAAADDAVKFLDGEELQGRRITARWFPPLWKDDGSGFEGYGPTGATWRGGAKKEKLPTAGVAATSSGVVVRDGEGKTVVEVAPISSRSVAPEQPAKEHPYASSEYPHPAVDCPHPPSPVLPITSSRPPPLATTAAPSAAHSSSWWDLLPSPSSTQPPPPRPDHSASYLPSPSSSTFSREVSTSGGSEGAASGGGLLPSQEELFASSRRGGMTRRKAAGTDLAGEGEGKRRRGS